MIDYNAYKHFHGKLPLVPILLQDNEKLIVKERMIEGKNISTLQCDEYLQLFNSVVNQYVNYFKQCIEIKQTTIGDILKESIDKGVPHELRSIYNSKLVEYTKIKIPNTILHGDFTYNNLIYDGAKCYFIDFEHYGEYSFFYDIFWLMQNEFVYAKNELLLNLYFGGELDVVFQLLFEAVGIKFNPEIKDVYYCVFLAEMYSKRLYNIDQKNDAFAYIQIIIRRFKIGECVLNE